MYLYTFYYCMYTWSQIAINLWGIHGLFCWFCFNHSVIINITFARKYCISCGCNPLLCVYFCFYTFSFSVYFKPNTVTPWHSDTYTASQISTKKPLIQMFQHLQYYSLKVPQWCMQTEYSSSVNVSLLALACSAVSRILLCRFFSLLLLFLLSKCILCFHLLVLWSFKALLVICRGTGVS